MADTGLTLTRQPPLSTATTATADAPASELWQHLAANGLADLLEREVVGLVGDMPAGERALALEEMGVTALDGLFASALAGLADETPINEERVEQARRAICEFGSAEGSALGLHAPLSALATGPLAVLDVADMTPTVAIRVESADFGGLRADQQRAVVDLFADLAETCDLHVVASGFVQTKLRRRYHEGWPVSEPCNALPPEGEVAARVEAARATLDGDGRETAIVRALADESSETASYHALYADAQASESRVRQCIGRLADLDLVATFNATAGRMVEVLAAGRQYLETLDSEIGRQRRLDDCVSETGNRLDDSRVTPHAHEGRPHSEGEGEEVCGSDGRASRHHQVRSMSRWRYAAAAGCAVEGGVSVADHPIAPKPGSQWGDPHWGYDHDADRLVVGCQYDNPMQGQVCIALALASKRTFDHVLTEDRFESGKLGDMLANHTDLLRNSRCLGYLKDADATPEGYRDALLAAAEDLRDLTKDFAHGNYEDRDRFRATITREAHGLAGTIAHLLDLADVDLVREFRIPHFSRDFKPSQKQDLAETIAVGTTIQSRYREFAAYRQLFESREDKRESTFPPTVDAEDPFGEFIGSFVLVGPGLDSFADRLRRRLDNRETHDDAPEFAVRVPVEMASERRHAAATVAAMCRQKSIRPTRAAVSVLAALTGTPHDAAEALHNLAPETKAPNREIRLDEVRFALSTLDSDRIMPDMSKPALSSIVHALLVAETPLAQADLADRANVSARSVRNHTETLAAFDFIRQTEGGWRFALPFRDDERGEHIAPWFVHDDEQDTPIRDVLGEALYSLLPPGRYADPDDPIAGALFAGPGEVVPKLRSVGWLEPWVRLVETPLDHEPPDRGPRTATVGIEPSQTSVTVQGAAG